MESSQARLLTTSRQLAKLSLARILYSDLVKYLSELRNAMATESPNTGNMGTPASRAVALAWVLATMAQSCASLATELQVSAEKLSVSQVTCQESTFNALYDSLEIELRLIDSMRESFVVINETADLRELPVLSMELVEVIRYWLDQEPAIITAEYMTNGGSQD